MSYKPKNSIADSSLSNLVSPTAANQDINPATAGGENLGSTSKPWNNANIDFLNLMYGANSVQLKAPSALTSYALTLPGAQGSAGQVMQNDGSGNLSWATPSGGGVTSLNSLTGALTLVAGSNISVTPAGSNITIAATDLANTALSNLASTAVNVDILPEFTGAHSVGTVASYFNGMAALVMNTNYVGSLGEGGLIDLSNKKLYATSFTNNTIDWASANLGYNGFSSLNWNSRVLYDSLGAGIQLQWNNPGELVLPQPRLSISNTVTPIGTTGDITLNQIAGTVNIAAGNTTVTVTNSYVTTNCIILATLQTDDVGVTGIRSVVPAAGSFTINLSGTPSSTVAIAWFMFSSTQDD